MAPRVRRSSCCTGSCRAGARGSWCCPRSSDATACWPRRCRGTTAGRGSTARSTPRRSSPGAERLLDEAGAADGQIVGNSLGGWLALKLAERGRARGRAARRPARRRPPSRRRARGRPRCMQLRLHRETNAVAPHEDALVATPERRRRAHGAPDDALRAHPGGAAGPRAGRGGERPGRRPSRRRGPCAAARGAARGRPAAPRRNLDKPSTSLRKGSDPFLRRKRVRPLSEALNLPPKRVRPFLRRKVDPFPRPACGAQ